MKELVFLGEKGSALERVFGLGRKERIEALGECVAEVIGTHNLDEHRDELKTVKYAFCTWGNPNFTEEQIRTYFPSLECLFYAAGSVQSFARSFLACGVRIFSAWSANAVPVAEAVFAQITLANKGFFHTLRKDTYEDKTKAALPFAGNFHTTVGVIGAGMIGSLVIRKCKELAVNVIVFDPFLSDERAAELGAVKADLPTLFSESDVITNHLADNEATRGMLDYACFSRMKERAVFINSGRGRQVVESDLVRALREEPERFTILDVTYPEPPEKDSPFYTLPNVILTPHIDGSWGNEVIRMADVMIEAFTLVREGKPCKCEVFESMLSTMA